MIRRIESRAGRALLIALGFLVATMIAMVPVGLLGASNLVWGEDNQYGRVDVPGTKVLHLPSGTVLVHAAVDLPGRGNQTPDLPLPSDLALRVSPVSGSARPVIRRDVGSSENANDNLVNTQRQVWSVEIPQDGDYRMTARGDFLGIGVNPQLWFGHSAPLHGVLIPITAAGLVLLVALVFSLIRYGISRRRAAPSSTFSPVGGTDVTEPSEPSMREARRPPLGASADSPDPVDRLAKLADLRDRGALTDEEFEAEKAKILSEG